MQLHRQLRELASQALNALVASDVPYFQQAALQLLLPLATHTSLEVTTGQAPACRTNALHASAVHDLGVGPCMCTRNAFAHAGIQGQIAAAGQPGADAVCC